MSKTLILSNDKVRETAREWIKIAPPGSTITFMRPEEAAAEKKKTNPQTDRFHAMVRDVARQVPEYGGIFMDEQSWKDVFLDALFDGKTRIVPKLNRMGMLPLSPHWKPLKIKEAMDAITIVQAFGDQNGVKFKADKILEASYGERR